MADMTTYEPIMDHLTTSRPTIHRTQFQQTLEEVIAPSVFGLITICGIIGNVLVIIVIIGRNKMRTATNLLLLNLAFADLIFVLVCPPFTAYQYAAHYWPFGNIICKLMHYIVNVSSYVTIYTLVLIAFIRYLIIVHNQRTKRVCSTANIIIMMICIWVVMLAANIPILFSYASNETGYFINGSVSSVECSAVTVEKGKQMFLIFFAFSYVLPLIIIVVFSACILQYMYRSRSSSLKGGSQTRGNQRKRQASCIIILVIVLFAALWLPVHLSLIQLYVTEMTWEASQHMFIMFLCQALAYFNSCVNPMVYNCVSNDFRERFKDVILCCCVRSHSSIRLTTRTTQSAVRSPETQRRIRKAIETDDSVPLTNGHSKHESTFYIEMKDFQDDDDKQIDNV